MFGMMNVRNVAGENGMRSWQNLIPATRIAAAGH